MKLGISPALLALALVGCGTQVAETGVESGMAAPATQVPAGAKPRATERGPGAADEGPGPAADAGAWTPELRMVVGPGLRDLFVPIEQGEYAESMVGPTLDLLREKSRALCRYKHGLEPLDDAAVDAFVSPSIRFVRTELGAKWSVIAGCWNFIRMNDRRPQRDFEVVRKLVPAVGGYECYGVGVLQPYIMSDVLNCRTLTMVDFDWQVHAVHWQLLQAWAGARLVAASIDQVLSGLRVDWIAYHQPRERHEVTIETLCHAGVVEGCRGELEAFGRRRGDRSLERITLNLAGLHEIELPPPRSGEHIPVIFLSNATEKHFLTRAEFDHMLERVEGGLVSGQRAIFVHHVANESTFGVYELVRTEHGSKLGVLCRDEYRKGPGEGVVYETWFEAKLGERSRKSPQCRAIPS